MDIVLWAFSEKAKKKDVLSFNVCKCIVQFWIDNITVSPNMKGVVRKHLGQKPWETSCNPPSSGTSAGMLLQLTLQSS
jgi:hypothetical protein